MPSRLDDAALSAALAELPGWRLDGPQALAKEFRFGTFVEAFSFMTRVALLAEAANHHPDWSNSYGRVAIRISTHSAGGLTSKDIALARAIDGLPG